MNYTNIGESVVTFVIFLMVITAIGFIAIVYSIGHLMGLWG